MIMVSGVRVGLRAGFKGFRAEFRAGFKGFMVVCDVFSVDSEGPCTYT